LPTLAAASAPIEDAPGWRHVRAEVAPPRPRDWTALPAAAALLADCAARPPATRTIKVTDLSTFHTPLYVGVRVRALDTIHRAEADRLFAACEAARDYAAFDAHSRRTVQQAIADTLIHAALARSAACDRRALEGPGEASGRTAEPFRPQSQHDGLPGSLRPLYPAEGSQR
jgi:hypothetical protein